MYSIGAKIFLAYWIATAIVITVANALSPEQLRRPELIRQAVRASLGLNGQLLAHSYETGGCSDIDKAFPSGEKQIYLATLEGQFLCGDPKASNVHELIETVKTTGKVSSKRYGYFQLVAILITSNSGHPYIVFLKSPYSSMVQFLGWMPGMTTFVISGLVTIVLAFWVTRPIRKLRTAARQIAVGNLDARVSWRGISGNGITLRQGDEIQWLMHDFNDMASRLQALVDAQRLLLRDVSHELRSPLSRLNVALELGREEATGTMHVHLDRIGREANRLNNLIGQLMALSYMDTLQEVAKPVNISFNKLVTDLLPDVQYEAAGRCHITATIMRNCTVCGDADLLQRALENIIRNAIHYTPQDGVVKIDLDIDESDGARRAVLRVSDNGPGVPDDELEAILRPFYRVDKARQSSTGGFGIGLAIADRATHLHEGKIVTKNHPDGGLMVEMYVPLAHSI